MAAQTIKQIPLEDVHADADFNCRGDILPIDVHELALDIKERGLLQPVIVSPYTEEQQVELGYKYRLIAGFRRFTAHRVIQAKRILCIIRPDMVDEAEARLLNLTENTQRKDLNILQEARALTGLRALGVNEFDIAKRLGMSRGWVQIRCILLKLPVEVHEEAAAGLIKQTQIRDLYSIYIKDGKDTMFEAIKRIKTAGVRGKKIPTINPAKTDVNIKRQRSRAEMFQMIERMLENDMGGLQTRALAWAAGEITTATFFKDMEEYSSEHDGLFIAPRTL